MKDFIDEYYKMIIYTIFGLLLVMASYSIILNVRHMKSLSFTTLVSDIDINYVSFKKNLSEIDHILDTYHEAGDNSLYLSINHAVTLLKSDGLFRLMPNSSITYRDLNAINDYFIETIYNNCWVTNLKQFNDNYTLEEIMGLLISDANYMRTRLINNGNLLSDTSKKDFIDNDYQYILKNYNKFSYIVLEMSQKLGGTYE